MFSRLLILSCVLVVQASASCDVGSGTTIGDDNPTTVSSSTGKVTEPTSTSTDASTTNTVTEEILTEAVNMCSICDINAIAPDPSTYPEGSDFYSEADTPVDGCLRTIVKCQRTDNKLCNLVYMYAKTATSTESITDNTDYTGVDLVLSCDADGTYSWNDVKGITQLTCFFNDCK